MAFLPLFTGIRHLAHVLTVPPTKACLLCATPAGVDLYIYRSMPEGSYRVQSPGFSKIVYYALHPVSQNFLQRCFDTVSSVRLKEDRLALPFSTPLSSRRSTV